MYEAFGNICISLYNSDQNFKKIAKALKKQTSLNNTLAIWVSMATFYIVDLQLCKMKMKREINNLKKEVEELKNAKGD